MFKTDVALVPHTVNVRVLVAPVFNILNTMMLMNVVHARSGLSDFVVETTAAMPEALRHDNEVVAHLLDIIEPSTFAQDLPSYLAALSTLDFGAHVRRALDSLCHKEKGSGLTAEQLLASKETYIKLVTQHYEAKGDEVDPALIGRIHDHLTQPDATRDFIIQHIQTLWERYLKDEWARVEPMVTEAVRVYEQLDLSDLTVLEAVQAITGRDMTGFLDEIDEIDEIIFVPSVHCGPYVTRFEIGERRMGLVFGARLPEGVTVPSVELSLRDLHIQLNALADDTRLHILELLTHHRELCSADFQQMLNLSQSSASRHLRQLVASGFIDERRRDLNKYFSLNTRRIHETSAALKIMFARRG
jgi:ArsR family transcriptional regulator